MESATILMPPSSGLSGILLYHQNPIFLKDQIMKKNINFLSMYGEKFYQLHYKTLCMDVNAKCCTLESF